MLDWLGREGQFLLSWWTLAWVAGLTIFPLLFRLMRGLPSRGYPLARAAGILLIGFVYWLLNMLGFLRNTTGSIVFVWLIVLMVAIIAYLGREDREHESLSAWLRQHWSIILTTELLFLAMFLGWASVRALNPNICCTEKPMDMAFMSALRRAETLPAPDPWMSGYSISYYYFGYLLAAMFAKATNVTNGMALNLNIAFLYALTGVSAFGVVYDLVMSRLLSRLWKSARATQAEDESTTVSTPVKPPAWQAVSTGVLAAFFITTGGNLGTALVEIPYETGIIQPASAYLKWLDLMHRPGNCTPSGQLNPATWCGGGGGWWWAYSRVVRDTDLNGNKLEIITEFPNFSYILADMHPHVMALPFTILAVGLAFNLIMLRRRWHFWELLLYAIWVGALLFLNTWDAVYLGLLVGAEGLRRLIWNRTGSLLMEDWWGIAGFGVLLGLCTLVLYAPFLITFRSQANGAFPSLAFATPIQQFFIMFGAFMLLIAGFLMAELRRGGDAINWRGAGNTLLSLTAGLLLLIAAMFVVAWLNADIRAYVFGQIANVGGWQQALSSVLKTHLAGLPTQLLLLLMVTAVIARLFPRSRPFREDMPVEDREVINYAPATGFALLLIGAGAILALLPEIIYLRDGFGTRMNTIFKFYYMVWTLWGLASAYAVWSVMTQLDARRVIGSAYRAGFAALAVVVVVAMATFPYAAILTSAFRDGGHLYDAERAWTMDGALSLVAGQDELSAIQCLNTLAANSTDVVAEATRLGVAYNNAFGRVSGLTGIPTLLGWDNHERQWRGTTFDAAMNTPLPAGGQERRTDAIERLYSTTDWVEAQDIVKRYGITYIFVGNTERNELAPQTNQPLFKPEGLAKFEQLTPVCQFGESAVYSAASIDALVIPTTEG